MSPVRLLSHFPSIALLHLQGFFAGVAARCESRRTGDFTRGWSRVRQSAVANNDEHGDGVSHWRTGILACSIMNSPSPSRLRAYCARSRGGIFEFLLVPTITSNLSTLAVRLTRAELSCAVPSCAELCRAVPSCAEPCRAVLSCAELCRVVPSRAEEGVCKGEVCVCDRKPAARHVELVRVRTASTWRV